MIDFDKMSNQERAELVRAIAPSVHSYFKDKKNCENFRQWKNSNKKNTKDADI